jgi:hypothetical protein
MRSWLVRHPLIHGLVAGAETPERVVADRRAMGVVEALAWPVVSPTALVGRELSITLRCQSVRPVVRNEDIGGHVCPPRCRSGGLGSSRLRRRLLLWPQQQGALNPCGRYLDPIRGVRRPWGELGARHAGTPRTERQR